MKLQTSWVKSWVRATVVVAEIKNQFTHKSYKKSSWVRATVIGTINPIILIYLHMRLHCKKQNKKSIETLNYKIGTLIILNY